MTYQKGKKYSWRLLRSMLHYWHKITTKAIRIFAAHHLLPAVVPPLGSERAAHCARSRATIVHAVAASVLRLFSPSISHVAASSHPRPPVSWPRCCGSSRPLSPRDGDRHLTTYHPIRSRSASRHLPSLAAALDVEANPRRAVTAGNNYWSSSWLF